MESSTCLESDLVETKLSTHGGGSVFRSVDSQSGESPYDPGMPGRNAEKPDGRSLGISTALLPVPKRVDADSHRFSELSLRQIDESTKEHDVLAALNLPFRETSPNLRGDRSSELRFCQLRYLVHGHPTYETDAAN